MAKRITGKEKRLHPRLLHNLPMRIAVNGYDFTTTSQNISIAGAYCHVNKYVPPFTKIAVKMSLPLAVEHKESTVECKGVIVRSEDGSKGGFNIAIFFNEINETQRKKISHYIDQFLPK